MKALSRPVSVFVLAATIFISCSGFGLVEHSCLMSERDLLATAFAQKGAPATPANAPDATSQTPAPARTEAAESTTEEYRPERDSSSLVHLLSRLLVGLCRLAADAVLSLVQALLSFLSSALAVFFARLLS